MDNQLLQAMDNQPVQATGHQLVQVILVNQPVQAMEHPHHNKEGMVLLHQHNINLQDMHLGSTSSPWSRSNTLGLVSGKIFSSKSGM
jgi:hypothetical protein